jgi:hypothetical protein
MLQLLRGVQPSFTLGLIPAALMIGHHFSNAALHI